MKQALNPFKSLKGLPFLHAQRLSRVGVLLGFLVFTNCTHAQGPQKPAHDKLTLRMLDNPAEAHAPDCKLKASEFVEQVLRGGKSTNPIFLRALPMPSDRSRVSGTTLDNSAYFRTGWDRQSALKNPSLENPSSIDSKHAGLLEGLRFNHFSLSEQEVLREEFRAAVLLGIYSCPLESEFRRSLNEFLKERTGSQSALSLNHSKIEPRDKAVWDAFQKTIDQVDTLKGQRSLFAKSFPADLAKALGTDLGAHAAEAALAAQGSRLGALQNLALAELAAQLHQKIRGKNIRTLEDLKEAAKSESDKALVKLLFGDAPAKGSLAELIVGSSTKTPLAELLLGPSKANLLRNTVLLGTIPSDGKGYSLLGGNNSLWGNRFPNSAAKAFDRVTQNIVMGKGSLFETKQLLSEAIEAVQKAKPDERHTARDFLQKSLGRLSERGIEGSHASPQQSAILAEEVRSALIVALEEIDNSLPKDQSPYRFNIAHTLPAESRIAAEFAGDALKHNRNAVLRRLSGREGYKPWLRGPDGKVMNLQEMALNPAPTPVTLDTPIQSCTVDGCSTSIMQLPATDKLNHLSKQPAASAAHSAKESSQEEAPKIDPNKPEPILAVAHDPYLAQRREVARQLEMAATLSEGHSPGFYGRTLSAERELPHQEDVDRIAKALSPLLTLGADERKRLLQLRPSALHLLAEMIEMSKPRAHRQDPGDNLRAQAMRSTEDWVEFVLHPKGKDNEIIALAAITHMGHPDSNLFLIEDLGRAFKAAKIPGVDGALFDQIRAHALNGENPIFRVDTLREDVEKAIDRAKELKISPADMDYLLLASTVLREWDHAGNTALTHGEQTTIEGLVSRYSPPNQSLLHAQRKSVVEQLHNPNSPPEVRRAAQGFEWLHSAYRGDGKGVPIHTSLAAAQYFASANSESLPLLQRLHFGMRNDDFHKEFSALPANGLAMAHTVDKNSRTYSPASHYLGADPDLVFQRRFAEALRKMYLKGSLDPALKNEISYELDKFMLARTNALAMCHVPEEGETEVDPKKVAACHDNVMGEAATLFGYCFFNNKGEFFPKPVRDSCVVKALANKAAQVALRENNEKKAREILAKNFSPEQIEPQFTKARQGVLQSALFHSNGLAETSWKDFGDSVERPYSISPELLQAQTEERTRTMRDYQDFEFQQKLEEEASRQKLTSFYTDNVNKANRRLEEVKKAYEKGVPLHGKIEVTKKMVKESEDYAKGAQENLRLFDNPERTTATAFLATIDQLDVEALIGEMYADPEIGPVLQELASNYAFNGKFARQTEHGEQLYTLKDIQELIAKKRGPAPDPASQKPVSTRIQELHDRCSGSALAECPFACREGEPAELCQQKQQMLTSIAELASQAKENPATFDRIAETNIKQEGAHRDLENVRAAAAVLNKMRDEATRQLYATNFQEQSKITYDRVVAAFGNNIRLGQSKLTVQDSYYRIQQARQAMEWGRALADSISSIGRGKSDLQFPDTKSANYTEHAKKWVKESGMSDALDQWLWLAKSGTLPLPPGKDAESYFYGTLLKNAMEKHASQLARRQEIERELKGIVQPTTREHPDSELWDWDNAKLSTIAPAMGPRVPGNGKWTADQLQAGGYRMDQDHLRKLLDEYSRTLVRPELGRNLNYYPEYTGQNEFDRVLADRYSRQAIDLDEKVGGTPRAIALSPHTAAIPMTETKDGKSKQVYNFTRIDDILPHLTDDAKKMGAWVEDLGGIHRAITDTASATNFWRRIGPAIQHGSKHIVPNGMKAVKEAEEARKNDPNKLEWIPPGVRFLMGALQNWNFSEEEAKSLQTPADNKVADMQAQFDATVEALEALGTTKMTYYDRDKDEERQVEARSIARNLRDKYEAVILPHANTVHGVIEAQHDVADEILKIAVVAAATKGLGSIAGVARTSGAVRNLLALQRLQRTLRYGTKVYTIGQGYINRGKLAVKGAMWGTAAMAPTAAYYHGKSMVNAEEVGNQIDKNNNGIPDWKEALDAGVPYRFTIQPKNPGEKLTTEQMAHNELMLSFDADDNGIPDSYEADQLDKVLGTYAGGGAEWYMNTRNSAKMMMLNPLGQVPVKGLFNLGALMGPRAKAFFNSPYTRTWEPALGQALLTWGVTVAGATDKWDTATSWAPVAAATKASAFMAPVDDIWGAAFMNKFLKAKGVGALSAADQRNLAIGVWWRKALINHIAQDGAQGAFEWGTTGEYKTKTGMKVTNPFAAIGAAITEGVYTSNRASKPGDAVLDMLPKFAELDLIQNGDSPLLRLPVPMKDPITGKPSTKTLGEVIASKADLHNYTSPEGKLALAKLYEKELSNLGTSPEEVAKAIEEGMGELGYGEPYLLEAKDFVADIIQKQRLKGLTTGKVKFEDIAKDATRSDSFQPTSLRVFMKPRQSDVVIVPTLGYHRLAVGDLVKEGSREFKNEEVRKAVQAVAKDYGMEPEKFEKLVLDSYSMLGTSKNPYLTLGSLARRGKLPKTVAAK